MRTILFFAFLSVTTTFAGVLPARSLRERPKLVMVLVIDQFRADYLTRYHQRFLPPGQSGQVGGFRYLMERGAYFPNAQYDVLQNMTGPGHATILTGAYPYQSGIPINTWFDAEHATSRYCVADADGTISPRALLASTVGDELKGISPGSRVVSLALKDRAAVLLGGHRADLALWFDVAKRAWVSSSFYVGKSPFPSWVTSLNATLKSPARRLAEGPSASTTDSTVTERPENSDLSWLESKQGIEITEQAAERAISGYRMGGRGVSDLLAISFSSHDYAGHHYGPDSPQLAALTMAEDQQLARLFNFTARQVPGGLQNVVVILTADHGIVSDPDRLAAAHLDAGRIDDKKLVQAVEAGLSKRFGKPSVPWVAYQEDLNFYLSAKAIEDRGSGREAVEEEVTKILRQSPGIAHAFSSSDYLAHRLPPGMFARQIEHTYFPGRSGDIVAIPKPFYIPVAEGVTHLTGYRYDSTVPLALAGRFIRAGVHPEAAAVIDLAPTLSFLLGTIPPDASEGKVLSSIF